MADQPVQQLSVGQRQLVSVARALAGRPTIVLLDEPAAGLDVSESRWLGERLRAIRDAGTTVIMVDHDMGLVLDVCDRIVVLDLGKIVAVGTPRRSSATTSSNAPTWARRTRARRRRHEAPAEPVPPAGRPGNAEVVR